MESNVALNTTINGVVLLDKGQGLSSNAALQKVKKIFLAKKAGHTGSLDPLATGILPICLGQATKLAGFLLNHNKRYFVRAKLGQTTDTGDSEGVIISNKETTNLNANNVINTSKSFLGEIEQIPPMYSALKKNGVPLYKLARQGIEIERNPRKIIIYSIYDISYKDTILSFTVECSKGTYIRTLITDIGDKLNCGAHVIELRRSGFAHFDISQTFTLEQLSKLAKDGVNTLNTTVIASENMLPDIIDIHLNQEQSTDVSYGREVDLLQEFIPQTVKLFNQNNAFIGIATINENGLIKPKRLFV